MSLRAHPAGDFDGLRIAGGRFLAIGTNALGQPLGLLSGLAVVRRDGPAGPRCSGVDVQGVVVENTKVPLLCWEARG